ncbi:MAG TPA: hypothetical protein VG457_18955, partial [Planctomycetota bacterium]|nr:hypothetical protein [Planctomycetota bacterium]
RHPVAISISFAANSSADYYNPELLPTLLDSPLESRIGLTCSWRRDRSGFWDSGIHAKVLGLRDLKG